MKCSLGDSYAIQCFRKKQYLSFVTSLLQMTFKKIQINYFALSTDTNFDILLANLSSFPEHNKTFHPGLFHFLAIHYLLYPRDETPKKCFHQAN